MKRFLLGTLSCVVILVALVALASRWAAVFWLLVLSLSVYLLFGRKVEVEFRLGIGGAEERRVYGALTWKRRVRVTESADTHGSARVEVSAARRDS